MLRIAIGRWKVPFLFIAVATAVYAAAFAIAAQLPGLKEARVVATALTVDLVVVVPAAFYVLVVRRRGVPLVTLVPVFILSVVAASSIVPVEHHQLLGALELSLIPMELGLLGWIGWRAKRALRGMSSEAEPLERFRRAAFELVRNDRAARVVASEVAAFYYALGSWRAKPHVPPIKSAHTHHRLSGHGAIVSGFLILLLLEGITAHVLLVSWSPLAAWIATISSLYGALWLIADWRAMILRPILIDEESLTIRAGLRTTVVVPRESILAIERRDPELGKESLNLTLMGTPTHWIRLSEPLWAQGLYGFRRRVRAIGVQPDEPEAFESALGLERD